MYNHAIAIVKGEAHYEPVSDYQVRPKPSPSPTACPRARLCAYGHRLAFAILLSQCLPVRPNAHPGRTTSPRPDPFAPSNPKKVSLCRATRSQPCLIQPHTRPTSSPRLRHFFPPIRPNPAFSPALLKHTHKRATLAHARDRPRGPETQPPKRGKAPSTRRGVPCGRPVAVKTQLSNPTPSPCPPLPRGATFVSRKPAPALQIGAGPTTPSARRRTECRGNERTSRFRGNNGVGGAK